MVTLQAIKAADLNQRRYLDVYRRLAICGLYLLFSYYLASQSTLHSFQPINSLKFFTFHFISHLNFTSACPAEFGFCSNEFSKQKNTFLRLRIEFLQSKVIKMIWCGVDVTRPFVGKFMIDLDSLRFIALTTHSIKCTLSTLSQYKRHQMHDCHLKWSLWSV